ncbi:MAG: Peroxiredoxin [Fibrobacteres bacterium]|nr:Peroxiredoxin [Fibrobacterota bacterium]
MQFHAFPSAARAAFTGFTLFTTLAALTVSVPFLSASVFAATQSPEAAAVVAPRPGATAPDFTLPDAAGKTHSLSQYRGKWVVLEWVNYDCPFVKKHYGSGNMQKLQKASRDKGAVWLSINSSAPGKQGHFEGQELAKRMADVKAQPDAYLLDPDGKVGLSYKAKTTPTMFVINPDGKVVYAGAIDDKPSTDQEDIPKATNYVQAALDAGLAGKPVATASTKSYGCGVKYKD